MGVNVPLAPPIPYKLMGGNAEVEMLIDNIIAPSYMAVDRLPDKGKSGVIYIKGMKEYIYTDKWECIGAVDVSVKPKAEPKKIQQCKICGGILKNNHCEYCGAEY